MQEEQEESDRLNKELGELDDKYLVLGGGYEAHRKKYESEKMKLR